MGSATRFPFLRSATHRAPMGPISRVFSCSDEGPVPPRERAGGSIGHAPEGWTRCARRSAKARRIGDFATQWASRVEMPAFFGIFPSLSNTPRVVLRTAARGCWLGRGHAQPIDAHWGRRASSSASGDVGGPGAHSSLAGPGSGQGGCVSSRPEPTNRSRDRVSRNGARGRTHPAGGKF